MRMWLINCEFMCKNHLLGEHLECHMLLGAIKKKHNLIGYMLKNLIQAKSLKTRHNELAEEMQRRGYNHNSELNKDKPTLIIDIDKSLAELISRCEDCKKLSG